VQLEFASSITRDVLMVSNIQYRTPRHGGSVVYYVLSHYENVLASKTDQETRQVRRKDLEWLGGATQRISPCEQYAWSFESTQRP
jgi:hypothetical protein